MRTSYDGRSAGSSSSFLIFILASSPLVLCSPCHFVQQACGPVSWAGAAASRGRDWQGGVSVAAPCVSGFWQAGRPACLVDGRTFKMRAARRGAGRSLSTVVMRMVMMGDRGGAPRADGSLLSWHGCSDSSSASFVPYLPTQLGRLKYVTQTHLKNSHMGSG